eukprot:TRINITY_DN35402_c0_g1_i1.p1 TRINITY_DN35402_c0_g1~~TRINITY_DN35402_c0_g1_i1.p1  ORF type:complete len:246 (+),score=23.77 TRINITY_DN35402_c0_g1_i1:56-739(+)
MYFVRDTLRDYYTNLLKQGIDTRGRGLIWIIQRLEKLGVHIESSMLPKFLSEISPSPKDFLEQLARLDIEITALKKHSVKNRKRISRERQSTLRKDAPILKPGETRISINPILDHSRPSSGFSLYNPKHSQGIVRPDPNISLEEVNKMSNSFLGEVSSPSHNHDYEPEITQKINEEKMLKKQYAAKLGKYFINIPVSKRKQILPIIVSALFGESSFELDIMKSANSS